jgi:hypothetical protein
MIIGVSGRIGHGKDEVAKIIQYLTFLETHKIEISYEQFKGSTLEMLTNWNVKKMAGKLKEVAGMLLNVAPSKFEDREFKNSLLGPEWGGMSIRTFLQKLGTEAMRNGLHEHTWANAFWVNYTEKENWIITDIRFPNEYESVKKRGGIMIHVHRPIPIPENEHESELALMGAEFDYYILNDFGIDGLLRTIRDILKHEKIIQL